MDFGIDTIVYIILGIVFLVAQASKKKKTSNQRVISSQDSVDLDEITPSPSLMEQLLSSREEQNIVQQTVEKEFYQGDTPPLSSDLKVADEIFNENLMKKKMEDLPMDKDYDSADQNRSSDKRSDFDLRKAIIYSVILERKYF